MKIYSLLSIENHNKLTQRFQRKSMLISEKEEQQPAFVTFMGSTLKHEHKERLQRDAEYRAKRKAQCLS